jgi:hypothetical protein
MTAFERIGAELASGMGFPPLGGTNEDYHLFFRNVKFLGNIK